MKLSRRLLAIVLAAALILGSVAVGAYAGITDYETFDPTTNPYTMKLIFGVSKYANGTATPYEKTAVDGGYKITAAKGDVIKVDVYAQANYYAGVLGATVAFDENGLAPTTNPANGLEPFAYATDSVQTLDSAVFEYPGYGYVPEDSVYDGSNEGTFAAPAIWTDGWTTSACVVDQKTPAQVRGACIPKAWQGTKAPYDATNFRTNKMACYVLNYVADANQAAPMQGFSMIPVEPVYIASFYVTVTAESGSYALQAPVEATRTSSYTSGKTYWARADVPYEEAAATGTPQIVYSASLPTKQIIPYKDVYSDNTTMDRVYDLAEANYIVEIGSGEEPPTPTVDKEALEAAIAAAEALNEEDYTPASWANLAEKLAAAQGVDADETATQDEVDGAESNLSEAINALVERVDKQALLDKIAEATAIEANPINYTPSSYGAFLAAYDKDAAMDVVNDGNATEKDVQDAIDAIDAALALLNPRADKDVLNQTIAAADALNEADYTPASWAGLAQALAAAKGVAGNDDADQEAVDNAEMELDAAIQALKAVVDKSALIAKIAEADGIDTSAYKPSSVAAFNAAYDRDAAMDVVNDGNADETAVQGAIDAITAALALLEEKADKDALQQAYVNATAVDADKYTASSIAGLTEAINDAADILADGDADQEDVDNAVIALDRAYGALVLLGDKTDLNAAIADAEAALANEANYTPDSFTAADLANAIAAAQAVANSNDVDQTAVDAAKDELIAAIDKLVLRADKSLLIAKIEEADAAADNADAYTPSSFTAFSEAYDRDTAQAVVENDNATEAEISGAITAVQGALDLLKNKADKTELQDAIATQVDLTEETATEDSWADYQNALTAANQINEDPEAEQPAVDTATANLLAAIDALNAKEPCDYTALDAAMAEFADLNEADYTEETWAAAQAAYDAANDIERGLLKDAAGQNQGAIDTAADELANAIEDLELKPVVVVDKSELEDAIEQADALNEDDYTEETWADLAVALEEAERVNAKEDATQEEVDNAKEDLLQAIDELQTKPTTDKSELEAAIEAAEALSEEDYTPTSWLAVSEKLADAKAIDEQADATQDQIDAAKDALIDAVNALKNRADKAELQAAVDDANAVAEEAYTPNSYAAFAEAYDKDAAEALLDNDDAEQKDVDDMVTDIRAALDLLKEKADKDALEQAINTEPAIPENEATDDSWAAYQQAKDAAIDVLNNPNAEQSEVDAAAQALTEAAGNVEYRGLCNYEALDAALDLEPEFDQSDYTASSWKAYAKAKADAEAIERELVNDKNGNNQAMIDDAAAALVEAFNALTVSTAGVVDVQADFSEYYKQHYMPYEVKVLNGASKIQLILPDGATQTYDRYSSAVSIASFNADGEEINYEDESPAYEIWTVNWNLFEGMHQVKAKYGKTWDKQAYEFEVEYAEYVPTVEFLAKAGEADFAKEVTIQKGDAITWQAVTPKDVTKVQLSFNGGAGTSTYTTTKAVADGDNLVWTIERGISAAEAEAPVVLKVKTAQGWQTADTDPVNVTIAPEPIYVPAVTFAAKTADAEDFATDITINKGDAITWQVVTPKDVIKVQLSFNGGAGTSTYTTTKAVADGDNLVWTIQRGISEAEANAPVVLKVKTAQGWQEADCGPVNVTIAAEA